jgi:hypothetical protein
MDDPELRVGATPRELIPGDVEAVTRLARRLQDIAVGCGEAADQLGGLRAADWQGDAAEAFADALDQEPGKYARAAEAFRDAALAVHQYAAVMEEAQHDALRAIQLFEEATARQARAQAPTDETTAAAGRPDTVTPTPPPTIDPDIAQARRILQTARERVQQEAEVAASHLSDAAEAAPNKRGWGSRFLHGAGEFFGGVGDATWGTGKFLWSVSQVRMVIDPDGWARDVKGIGEGFVWGWSHKVEFAKAIVDWDTWKENPARAAGRLVPDIALTLATVGAGAAGKGIRAVEETADIAEDLRATERAAEAAEAARAAKRTAEGAEDVRAAQRSTDLADHNPRRSPAMDEARRARLHQDWDHDGQVTKSSTTEAEIGEDLEARGILAPVDRPMGVTAQGDLLDADGQWWDVKGPQSREAVEELRRAHARSRGLPEPTFDPSRQLRGEFDLNEQVGKVRDMVRKGRGVILDHRGLNDGDFRLLKEAVEREGVSERVIWYP